MASSTSLGQLAALTGSRHGVTTRRRAEAVGVGKNAIGRLIERGVLVEPVSGVLVVAGSPKTWNQEMVVATFACREQGLAIGPSSTRLHRVDGFETDETVMVALPKGRSLQLDGVTVSQTLHTYPMSDRFVVDGIACSGLARAICDIAPLGAKVLERSIDDFQRRGYSLEWLRRTAEPLRVRGRAAIGSVFAEIDRRSVDPAVRGSWFEQFVEECLRSSKLPGVCRQYVVRDERGGFIGRVDLAVPAVRVAIEAHSRKFHTGPAREQRDEDREHRGTEEGWLFEYVGWRAITQTPAAVRAHIERVVARRALDLGVTL